MKQTKAMQVRAIIAVAKSEGKTQEDILEQVMAASGHPKGLARAYIKGNWDKVEDPSETIGKMCEQFVEGLGDVQPIALSEEAPILLLPAPAVKRTRKQKEVA
jgi:hypothetical protein